MCSPKSNQYQSSQVHPTNLSTGFFWRRRIIVESLQKGTGICLLVNSLSVDGWRSRWMAQVSYVDLFDLLACHQQQYWERRTFRLDGIAIQKLFALKKKNLVRDLAPVHFPRHKSTHFHLRRLFSFDRKIERCLLGLGSWTEWGRKTESYNYCHICTISSTVPTEMHVRIYALCGSDGAKVHSQWPMARKIIIAKVNVNPPAINYGTLH